MGRTASLGCISSVEKEAGEQEAKGIEQQGDSTQSIRELLVEKWGM
ncbi:hypothetical protein [Nostoc sp. FACHB-888]|nr:hypothetical protein [Nostoc sp. FACHB-888]MBD2242092.1 hypothetical protein [Nostoc sp. FACHB-888]